MGIEAWVHRRRQHDEAGASAVEYGLLVAGIAAIIVLVVFAFGGVIKSNFTKSCSTINSKVSSSTTSCSG